MQSTQFSSFLILSVFEGKYKWIGLVFMMIIPYIKSYIDRIWAMILIWWYPDTVSITLKQRINKDEVPLSNFAYRAMCWYSIEKYCEKQKSLLCETDTVKKNEKVGNNTSKRIPDYFPNNNYRIVHNKNIVFLSFSDSASGKTVTLRSSSMKILKDFVIYVISTYEEHCYSTIDPCKMYVCKWKPPRYNSEDGDFVSVEMKIKKTYNNVYLPSKLLDGINKDIHQFKTSEDFYEEKGIPYKRGYLFYGPPGTGKTSTVYALARENNMNLYKLDWKNIKGARIETSLKIMTQKIPSNSVVLIEEVDTQVYNDRVSSKAENKTRDKTNNKTESDKTDSDKTDTDKTDEGNKSDNNKTDGTISLVDNSKKLPMSELMDVLDGYDTLHGCIIILTTNHKEYLDDALIRPGRVDIHYLFDLLGPKDVKTTIKRFTGFDINIPPNITMTSSTLINQILLPNRTDRLGILNLINQDKQH